MELNGDLEVENRSVCGKIPSDYATCFLGSVVTLKIERPLNSNHPVHGFKYLLNYGYIPNSIAPDGEEVDGYVLGVSKPLKSFKGRCIAVIHRTNDEDDKLIVVEDSNTEIKKYSKDEKIMEYVHFQEQFFKSKIIRSKKT